MEAFQNRVLTTAGLAEGTNANTFKTVNAGGTSYTINGVMYSLASTDNIAFSSGHAMVPLLSECVFGVDVDAAGNVTTVQGPILLSAKLAAGEAALQFPGPTPNKARLGYIRVKCASTATFTPNVTDLGAANVTDTYYNTSVPPQEPLRS